MVNIAYVLKNFKSGLYHYQRYSWLARQSATRNPYESGSSV